MSFQLPQKFQFFSILFYFFLIPVTSIAQHFEWAASAGNIDLRYSFSSIDHENNVVVGGEGQTNYTHRGKPEIYDAEGNVMNVNRSLEESNIIVSYSPEGKINWNFEISTRNAILEGITHDESGNTVLLLDVKQTFTRNKKEAIGSVPELPGMSLIPAGYYLVWLDSKGVFTRNYQIFKNEFHQLEISSFQYHPAKEFVITGFTKPGKLCDELTLEAGPSGGDFLLVLDASGAPLWGDIISYGAKTCCSWFSNSMCKPAFGPDGTIFLGGTYRISGIFGGKKKFTAPTLPDDDQYHVPFETYLASYTALGKLNWVKTSVARSYFFAISTTQNGVAMSFNLQNDNFVFGKKTDTTGNKNMVIAFFDKNGKLKWLNTTGTDRAHEIKSDRNNYIYVLGTFRNQAECYHKSGTIGKDTLSADNNVFIARYSENGEYQWIKEAHIPVVTIDDPLRMVMDDCSNMYLTGTLWFVLPGSLSNWDKAFVKGKGYGAVPFVSRFNNTLPTRVVLRLQKDSFQKDPDIFPAASGCVISPGPWKLKVFPNPFKDQATLEYSLSYADDVTMEIYDLSGKLVATLIKNQFTEVGKYELAFRKHLTPGNYIVMIKGSGTVATCKFTIVQ